MLPPTDSQKRVPKGELFRHHQKMQLQQEEGTAMLGQCLISSTSGLKNWLPQALVTRCLFFFFNLHNCGFCSHSVIFLSDRQVSERKSLTCVQLFETPWAIQSMDSPGQNPGVGSLSLFQGIFPTQGSKPLRCRWILYQLHYLGGQIQAS